MKPMIPSSRHSGREYTVLCCITEVAERYHVPGNREIPGKVSYGGIENLEAAGVQVSEANRDRVFEAGAVLKTVALA